MKNYYKVLIGIILVLLVWSISWYLMFRYIPSTEERGQFGDMFGAVNSIFSGLALIGVVYSIFLQIESNRKANIEFKHNSCIELTYRLVDQLNKDLDNYKFIVLDENESYTKNYLDFNNALNFYNNSKKNENIKARFIKPNLKLCSSIAIHILETFTFLRTQLSNFGMVETNQENYIKLFTRSIKRNFIDFLHLELDCIQFVTDNTNLSDIDSVLFTKEFLDIRGATLTELMKNTDYKI